MNEEKIRRINELYHKSKEGNLSEEEQEERRLLREEYIASVRKNLKSQLDRIDVRNEDGTTINLGEKRRKSNGGER